MRTQNQIIQLTDPVELLSYFHYRLGFWPADSVCILGLREAGQKHSPDVIARIDTGAIEDGADLGYVAEHFLSRGCTSVLLGIVNQTATWDELEEMMLPIIPWVREWATLGIESPQIVCYLDEHIAVVELVDSSWHVVSPFFPANQLKASSVSASMVLAGHSPAAQRQDIAAPPFGRSVGVEVSLVDSASSEHLWSRIEPIWLAARAQSQLMGESDTQSEQRKRWEQNAPLLVSSLHVGEIRDRILLGAFDPEGTTSVEVANLAREVLLPNGPAPNLELHIATVASLERLLPFADGDDAAILYAMLAWLGWLIGDGARADVVSQQALALSPDQPLAQLVQRALIATMAPGWLILE